ncbi:DUF2125 domain-containing protein [Pseudovibrio exalbescens]|uniref:DUF2125 domain-containing protein n=1 Tax=Pseudovibrio exalbescens TaxID=197461 RepID=UPI0023664AB9|nr:DUF2125 domain-containing protein [Pseudovibrio exalbescens]MDD7909471.1 DUF2125 domain-containing protein [Pseudovibrio exalbescens]
MTRQYEVKITIMSATASPKKPSKKSYIILGVMVVLGIAAWSTYWSIGRGMISDTLTNTQKVAAAEGDVFDCANKRVGGYPFRFEVTCSPLRIERDGQTVFAHEVRGVALAYQPMHMIFEADSPFEAVAGPGGPGYAATWDMARLSANLAERKIEKADMVIENPSLSVVALDTPLTMAARNAEVHIRANGEEGEALDAAILLQQLTSETMALDLPIDLELIVTAPKGGSALEGKVRSLQDLLVDGKVDLIVRSARLSSGTFYLQTEGPVTVDEQGRLSGTLPVTISGVDKLAAVLKPLFPEGSQLPQNLQATALSIGKSNMVDGQPTIQLPITLDRGRARIAFINLGRVPNLF